MGSPSSFCNETASPSSAVQHVSWCSFQHLQSNSHHLYSAFQHFSISIATQSSCKQKHNLTSSHADEIQSERASWGQRGCGLTEHLIKKLILKAIYAWDSFFCDDTRKAWKYRVRACTRRASFPATGTLLLAATDDAPVRSEIGNDSNLRSDRG